MSDVISKNGEIKIPASNDKLEQGVLSVVLGIPNIIQTPDGVEMSGANEALSKCLSLYPTYEELQNRHNECFKVKERLKLII